MAAAASRAWAMMQGAPNDAVNQGSTALNIAEIRARPWAPTPGTGDLRFPKRQEKAVGPPSTAEARRSSGDCAKIDAPAPASTPTMRSENPLDRHCGWSARPVQATDVRARTKWLRIAAGDRWKPLLAQSRS